MLAGVGVGGLEDPPFSLDLTSLRLSCSALALGGDKTLYVGRGAAVLKLQLPRKTGTGGRIRQLGISKRGDASLRTLLMHGARAVVRSKDAPTWPWLAALLQRRPYSVVA